MFYLMKSFFRRISQDFKQKKLLPLKLIFFVQASTLHVLYPYLTIHMRELGINVEETAIMNAVTPFVAIIMPPVAGLIADRIGNFKILLSFFSSLGGAAALLLLLVPVGRATVKYPDEIIMDLSCNSKNNDLMLAISDMKYNCQSIVDKEIKTKIESCGYVCQLDNQTNYERVLKSRFYNVKYIDLNDNRNYLYKYDRPKADYMQGEMSDNEIREHRRYRNHEFYKSSIRLLNNNSIYFPTDELYKFLCLNNYTNKILCKFQNNYSQSEKDDQLLELNAKLSAHNKSENQHQLGYKIDGLTFDHLNTKYNQVKCENEFAEKHKVSVIIPDLLSTLIDDDLSSESESSLTFNQCNEKCIATAPRKDVCANLKTVVDYNISLTFWLYLGIRVFIGIIGGTAFAMFEGAVIAILREQEADYGLQRIYGSIGSMISSPLSGLLIDYASEGKDYTDFRPAFYLYAALKIASGALMLAINLEFKAPAHNVVGDVISVLKNIEIAALLLACFILGSAWGYIESFLFWLIQDLGGSKSLMGITITIGGIAGIPLLVLSGPIIDKIGHANVLFIGFVFYAVRLLGYSLIYNPWHCLIFEALESVTSSLSFTAAVTYAAKLSTASTDSSIQGLLGGLYYGVGKGSGSLIGGFLMKAFGTRPTYQIFAVVCILCGLVYFFFNLFYLKKQPQVEGNAIVKKKPKQNVVENGLESGEKQKESKEMGAIKGTDNLAFEGGKKPQVEGKAIEKEKPEENVSEGGEKQKESRETGAIKGADNPAFEDATNPPQDSGKETTPSS